MPNRYTEHIPKRSFPSWLSALLYFLALKSHFCGWEFVISNILTSKIHHFIPCLNKWLVWYYFNYFSYLFVSIFPNSVNKIVPEDKKENYRLCCFYSVSRALNIFLVAPCEGERATQLVLVNSTLKLKQLELDFSFPVWGGPYGRRH